MSIINLKLITDEKTGDIVGASMDDIPPFKNLLIDDERELVFWRVKFNGVSKIAVSDFDNWNKYLRIVRETYREVYKDEK